MEAPRKLIRIIDKSVYTGPTTLEELRGLRVSPEEVEARESRDTKRSNISTVNANRCDYDREQIVALIAAGHTGDEIAAIVGCSTSLVSRIKNGKR